MIADILNLPEIKKLSPRPFEYAGFNGMASCIGWFIIIFTRKGQNKISVISLDDIHLQPKLTDLSNKILKLLNLRIKIGESINKIIAQLGKPQKSDTLLEKTERLYYLNNNCLLCIGIHEEYGIVSFDAIFDSDIINCVLNN